MLNKKGPNSKKIINKIVLLIDQILFLIKDANIFSCHFIYLIGNLNLEKELISNLNPETDIKVESIPVLNEIREACEYFYLLLVLLQKSIWPKVSLSLNVETVLEEIDEFQDTITKNLQLLDINIESYMIQKEISKSIDIKDAEIDLFSLYTYYHQPSNYEFLDKDQYCKLEKQRQRISHLFDKYSMKKLDYVLHEVNNPIDYAKIWKFDISKLPKVEPTTEEFYGGKWSIYTYKMSNNSALVKISIPFDRDISNKKQKRFIKRRFMLLSTLDSKLLLKFIGGSIEDVANYYFQIDIDPQIFGDHFPSFLECLYNIYSIKFDLKHTAPTKICFFIAMSMFYLHSHSIIHGNLSLTSIFCINEMENTPIWNFKISTGVGYIPKRSPPEFLKKGIYIPESDVYQYGLLLFQIATNKKPFDDVDEKYLSEAICNPEKYLSLDGKDDKGNDYFSPGMKQLIRDCWNQDPSKRPTFEQIIYRFLTEDIYIKDPDLDNLTEFLFFERSKKFDCLKYSEGLDKFEELLDQNQKMARIINNEVNYKVLNAKEISKFLIRMFLVAKSTNQLIEQIKHLDSFGFFERIIPFFNVPDEKVQDELIKSYLKIYSIKVREETFSLKKFTNKFLTNGGTQIIAEFMKKEGNSHELAELIFESIEPYITDEVEESLTQLVPIFIEAGKIDYVQSIVLKRTTPLVACRLIEQNIKELSKEEMNLVEFYVEHSPEIKGIDDISARALIKSGNYKLLTRLMKSTNFLSSITNDDCKEVIETIASDTSDENQKRCAVLLSLGLDKDFFEVLSKFNVVVDKVVHMSDQELASRFIARLTYFKTSSEYLLSGLEKETNNEYEPIKDMKEPFYLISLSRIARVNTNRFISLPFLKDNIIRNIKNHQEVEGTLRLAGVLSRESSFWTDLKVANAFIQSIISRSLNTIEMELILLVISNIIYIKEVKDLFSEPTALNAIIFIIENNGAYSGIAMRILARLNIPSYSSETRHQFERIVSCIKSQLSEGNGFGVEGSAQVIINIIENEENTIEDIINIDEIYNLVIERSKKERNAQIFIKLMECINMFERGPQSELIPLFSNIIMNNRGQLPDKFYILKSQLT